MIIDLLCEKYSLNKEKCLMVGDTLKTDITIGKNSGIDQLLVLTGNTTK